MASEALYHLLGGKGAGWKPMTLKHEGVTHWYLTNTITGQLLDPTAVQFATWPDHAKGRGRGFLTKMPSDRARKLMDRIVWQGGEIG